MRQVISLMTLLLFVFLSPCVFAKGESGKVRLQIEALGKKAPVNRAKFAKDLRGLTSGVAPPSEASVSALADHLVQALTGKPLDSEKVTKVVTAVFQAFNAHRLSDEGVKASLKEMESIFAESKVSPGLTQQVKGDLRGIASQVLASFGKTSQMKVQKH